MIRSGGVNAMVMLLVSAGSAVAQDRQELSVSMADSLSRRNVASILFERNLNTFNWAGIARVDTVAFGNRIRLNEVFTSNIILLEASRESPPQRLRSDQQQLMLQLSRPLNEDLEVRGQWSSLIYSDRKAVGLSTASINSVLGGVDYSPEPWLVISPLIGHRWDNQFDARDRGLSYNIGARTRGVDLDGYQIVGSGQFARDILDPRILERHFVRFGAQKNFLGSTRDSLEVGFSRTRREFYTSTSGTLESRGESILSFVNLLDYEFEPSLVSSFFINVYSRKLDKDYRDLVSSSLSPDQYDRGIDEFRLETFAQTVFRNPGGGLAASIRFSYSERNERHFARNPPNRQAQEQEQTKDNLARRTSLAGTLSLPLSSSDTVALAGAASILRYDTPSEANVEDRDEVLGAFSILTVHRLSRYLDVSFALDGTISHIVYLLEDRSANNNINRVLRFAPRTVYRPFPFLTTMNTFEVLANYTVYDFEAQAAQVQSFSYRQFGWIDSTALELSDRVGLDFFVYLKLYDRGQLNWKEFSERRENSFVDKTYAAQVRFSPGAGMLFALGLRYFSQSRYSFAGTARKLDSFLRSFGPTCMIVWQVNAASEVMMRGWYEERRLEGGGSRSLANMTLTITLTL